MLRSQESNRLQHEYSMNRTFASSIDKNHIGQNLTFVGWLEDFRDMGKIGFISVRDMTGNFQGVLTGELLSGLREIPRQSVIVVNGTIQDTRAENFQVEVRVEKVELLSMAINPLPIDPTGRVKSSLDKRLDSRALDLRNFKISKIFRTRSYVLHLIRKFLYSKMFVEVNTPKIIGTATEGGADLFGFEYFSKKAFLAQSPQLYKEQLTLGLERVFEISSYFRAEPSHTVRHLSEFVSVDLEAAFLEYGDIMDIVQDLVISTINDLYVHYDKQMTYFENKQDIMVDKIPRITYEKCLEDLKSLGEKIEFGDDLSDPALKKLGEIYSKFYFIIDWPTKLKPFYILEHDKKSELSRSFDLQYGYLEIVSGGTREHDSERLKSKLLEKGLNPKSFSDHLQTFEWGMPPHSGCGLGFDRFIMILTNSTNIREVVLYPRDTERLSP
ncbi:MAG: aspartate--tRNA(Asn) ligase [Nitrososphaeraceae archaeon]|nr:aspartate--tRNA(Asn) ligase [Nitrososphaeraceae archaeon]